MPGLNLANEWYFRRWSKFPLKSACPRERHRQIHWQKICHRPGKRSGELYLWWLSHTGIVPQYEAHGPILPPASSEAMMD